MSYFTKIKNKWLVALLFCLLLTLPGCEQSAQKSIPYTPFIGTTVEPASGSQGSLAGGGQAFLAAPSAKAFRCYTLNNCQGNYTPGVATVKACADLGGNSWTNSDGVCVPGIGE